MLEEDGVVGAAAEIADGDVGMRLRGGRTECAAGSFLRIERVAAGLGGLAPHFVDGAALRAGHGLGDVAQKLLEARDRGRAEFRS